MTQAIIQRNNYQVTGNGYIEGAAANIKTVINSSNISKKKYSGRTYILAVTRYFFTLNQPAGGAWGNPARRFYIRKCGVVLYREAA